MFRTAIHTRDDYDRAFGIVREAVHRADPEGLFAMGAPADEWDAEIARFLAQLTKVASESDVARTATSFFSLDRQKLAQLAGTVVKDLIENGLAEPGT